MSGSMPTRGQPMSRYRHTGSTLGVSPSAFYFKEKTKTILLCFISPFMLQESTMTEEFHRSSAAEISVTSNGDLDQNPETVFQRVNVCLEVFRSCFSEYKNE